MVDRRALWKYKHDPFGLVAFRTIGMCPDERLFEQQHLPEQGDGYRSCPPERQLPHSSNSVQALVVARPDLDCARLGPSEPSECPDIADMALAEELHKRCKSAAPHW